MRRHWRSPLHLFFHYVCLCFLTAYNVHSILFALYSFVNIFHFVPVLSFSIFSFFKHLLHSQNHTVWLMFSLTFLSFPFHVCLFQKFILSFNPFPFVSLTWCPCSFIFPNNLRFKFFLHLVSEMCFSFLFKFL